MAVIAAVQPPGVRSRKPDSGNIGSISITVGVRRTGWNAMKPRIQCVLAQ
jgi:hypothetical protein